MENNTWKVLEKILDELSDNGNKIAFFKFSEHWAIDLSLTKNNEESTFAEWLGIKKWYYSNEKCMWYGWNGNERRSDKTTKELFKIYQNITNQSAPPTTI